MFKYIIILMLSLLTKSFVFGQNISNNYKIYSLLIKADIINKTKSIIVISKFKNDTTAISWTVDAIKLKDPQQLEQLRFVTRDEQGEAVKTIDIATQDLILDFYQSQLKDSLLQNLFDVPNVKIFLVDNFPLKKGSQNKWKRFYKKYPSSGGVFQFSNICFSKNTKEAIVYHSLFRNGLNAYGALTIVNNIDGQWRIKYQIYMWQAWHYL